jgi:RNA polymerase sigma factor (sigma-70 family)
MDDALIYSLQQDSEEAFRGVYNEYHPKLYGYFLKKTKSPGVSEDLVQETFIKLWRFRAGLNAGLPLSIQIFRIARTTIIDLLRKNARSRVDSLPLTHITDLADSMREREPAETSPALALIIHTLSRLSPMRRKIIEQRLEGFSNHEIAANLSISKKTVENQINRAFQEIKKHAEVSLPVLLILLISSRY